MKPVVAALMIAFAFGTLVHAQRPRADRNVAYVDGGEARQKLDVYSPRAAGEDRPTMVWMHGGAWRFGNKIGVQEKPQAFVDRGFVFVSINYRFVPNVTVKEQAEDVAAAIAWVRDNAAEYGGSPDKIFVGGHSAGAHLAALVCTDLSYLKAAKVPTASILGCVPVDTAVLDVAAQIESRRVGRARLYTSVFGDDAASQKKFSPIEFIGPNKDAVPPFCILHVASRADSTARAKAFAAELKEHGVAATLVAGENKTHETINKEIGQPDDAPTKLMFKFLNDALHQ